MNTSLRLKLIVVPLLALVFASGQALRAQNTPDTAVIEQPPTTAAPAAPAEEPAKPQPTTSQAAAPEVPAVATTPTQSEEKQIEPAQPAVTAPTEQTDATAERPKSGKRSKKGHHSGNPQVGILQDSTLAAGQQADAVVSILGSSTSAGEVNDAVVSVMGSSTSSGEVGGPVVSVFGNTRVTGGIVGEGAVAVLGNTYVNGRVKGGVVAVLGNIELGPDAVVEGEIVCVGGEVKRDPQATVRGKIKNVAIAGGIFHFDWLNTWITKCLLYARPLAFDANLLWAWWIALGFLGFYGLVALIAPQGVTKCVQTLDERPGYSVLSAVLAMLLTPVAYLLLVITLAIGLGFMLIPLFSLGLFFASLFGKVVILAWLGRRITKIFGDGRLHPAFGVLIGGVLVLGLYTVPVLGFIVYKLIGLLGLGVVLYTLVRSSQNKRAVAAVPAAMGTPAVSSVAPGTSPMGPAPTAFVLPPVISAATLPRAGFWRRLAASLLDLILVAIVFGILSSMLFGVGGAFPLWLAIYSVVMWATKGTTIGGIICGLKVVRIDDRPLDWSVAIVRGLSAFLSLAVAGLGFIWVAFDDDRQSWHDKIAGTTIVTVPKGTSLL